MFKRKLVCVEEQNLFAITEISLSNPRSPKQLTTATYFLQPAAAQFLSPKLPLVRVTYDLSKVKAAFIQSRTIIRGKKVSPFFSFPLHERTRPFSWLQFSEL